MPGMISLSRALPTSDVAGLFMVFIQDLLKVMV